MRKFLKMSVLPTLGLGVMLASATSASASIACNGEGACWHVRHAYHYAPGYGVVVHPEQLALGSQRTLHVARTFRPRLLARRRLGRLLTQPTAT